MSYTSAQLDEYLAFAIDLGRRAGELIKQGQAKRFSSKSTLDTKANSVDVSGHRCATAVAEWSIYPGSHVCTTL